MGVFFLETSCHEVPKRFLSLTLLVVLVFFLFEFALFCFASIANNRGCQKKTHHTEHSILSLERVRAASSTKKKVTLIVQNASGTQTLTLHGLSNHRVLPLGAANRETVSRDTAIFPILIGKGVIT